MSLVARPSFIWGIALSSCTQPVLNHTNVNDIPIIAIVYAIVDGIYLSLLIVSFKYSFLLVIWAMVLFLILTELRLCYQSVVPHQGLSWFFLAPTMITEPVTDPDRCFRTAWNHIKHYSVRLCSAAALSIIIHHFLPIIHQKWPLYTLTNRTVVPCTNFGRATDVNSCNDQLRVCACHVLQNCIKLYVDSIHMPHVCIHMRTYLRSKCMQAV